MKESSELRWAQYDELAALAMNPETVDEFFDKTIKELVRIGQEFHTNPKRLHAEYGVYEAKIGLIQNLMADHIRFVSALLQNVPPDKLQS